MWEDTEVVLDDSAFEFVQARARLRIITPGRAPSIKPERLSSSPRLAVASEPPLKRVKVENSLDGQSRVEIDLTKDERSVDKPIAAQEEEPLLVVKHSEGAQKQNSQLDAEGQTVAEDEATSQSQPVPNGDLQTGAAHHTATRSQPAQSQAAAQNVQPSPLQAVAIRRLTAHNFDVDAASPTRTVPPQRQLIPHQWVDCREPWPGSEKLSGPNLGRLNIRVLTGRSHPPHFLSSVRRY